MKTEKLKKYKLGDIADIIVGFPFESEKFNIQGNGVRLVRGMNVSERYLRFGDDSRWWSELTDDLLPYYLKENDIVIGMDGSKVGRNFAIVNKNDLPLILVQRVACIRAKENFNQKFIWQYISSSRFLEYVNTIKTGSAIPHISGKQIADFPIFVPSHESQQKIASVLSALDDKIALNRRMNAKLEQMSKRLYDHWFVQFDFPDADGKPYKSSGGKMEYNEVLKREIPAGWEAKKLGDVCEIVLGGTPSTACNEFWENGTINWLNSGEAGIFPIVESEKKITEIAVEKSTTEFLKAGSVTLSITRYLRPSILAIDACINQSVVGIKENDLFKNCFLYPYLQNEIDRLMSLRTGAQQPHINKEIVEDSFINIPPKELMEKYEKKVTPIYLQIINIAKETQKLTVLRDRLLPLLMNGQVEVK